MSCIPTVRGIRTRRPRCRSWTVMRKLSLGRLLHLVVIVPLCVLAAFGGVLVLDSLRAYREIERASAIEQLITAAGRLTIKALSQESDAARAYVASGMERERLE